MTMCEGNHSKFLNNSMKGVENPQEDCLILNNGSIFHLKVICHAIFFKKLNRLVEIFFWLFLKRKLELIKDRRIESTQCLAQLMKLAVPVNIRLFGDGARFVQSKSQHNLKKLGGYLGAYFSQEHRSFIRLGPWLIYPNEVYYKSTNSQTTFIPNSNK